MGGETLAWLPQKRPTYKRKRPIIKQKRPMFKQKRRISMQVWVAWAVHLHIYTHIYVYIHVYTHINTHTYIHIYVYHIYVGVGGVGREVRASPPQGCASLASPPQGCASGLFCRIRRAVLPYMFLARPRSLARSLSRVRARSLSRARALSRACVRARSRARMITL